MSSDMTSDDCADVDEQIVISANSQHHREKILRSPHPPVLKESNIQNEEANTNQKKSKP